VTKNSEAQRRVEMKAFVRHLFAPIGKELKLAQGRVGLKPVDRLRWLLEFAHLDLTALSQGRLTDLGWEILGFVLPPNLEHLSDAKLQEVYNCFYIVTAPYSKDEIPKDGIERVSDHLIRGFHPVLKNGLESLFATGRWEIAMRPITKVLLFHPRGGAIGSSKTLPSPEELVLKIATGLIETEGRRLHLCNNPKCRRPFVSARTDRAMYCSARCSAYVRVNRARGKTDLLKDS